MGGAVVCKRANMKMINETVKRSTGDLLRVAYRYMLLRAQARQVFKRNTCR